MRLKSSNKKIKILLSWCHSDCTYSLLEVLSLIPNIEIFLPSKPIKDFISFTLNYREWPINQFKDIIKPLDSIKLQDIDYFFAEIVNISLNKNKKITDSQVEWGIKNLGIDKIIIYCYNLIGFNNFQYSRLPILTSCKHSFQTHLGPKHFFYAKPPILNFSYPRKLNHLYLIQNSYEIQKNSYQYLYQILEDPFFANYKIKYYGFTKDKNLKKINAQNGQRISREKINKIIEKEMSFALHLKDHEGYGYHALKCMFAGRPIINHINNIRGMTYEDYLVDDETAILFNDVNELKQKLIKYQRQDELSQFSLKCHQFVKKYFNFENENIKASKFIKEIIENK